MSTGLSIPGSLDHDRGPSRLGIRRAEVEELTVHPIDIADRWGSRSTSFMPAAKAKRQRGFHCSSMSGRLTGAMAFLMNLGYPATPLPDIWVTRASTRYAIHERPGGTVTIGLQAQIPINLSRVGRPCARFGLTAWDDANVRR